MNGNERTRFTLAALLAASLLPLPSAAAEQAPGATQERRPRIGLVLAGVGQVGDVRDHLLGSAREHAFRDHPADREPGGRERRTAGFPCGGDLEHAGLDRLHVVAQPGHRDDHHGVGQRGDLDLVLPDAHGLNEHDVVPRGLHQHDRLAGGAGDTAERPGAG